MAKNKWDQLRNDLIKRCGELDTIPNATAEEAGALAAFVECLVMMEALEKSLTKPEPYVILIVDGR